MPVWRPVGSTDAAVAEYVATLSSIRRDEEWFRRPSRILLEVMEGADAGRQYPVHGNRITIGRGHSQDVQLTDASVSNTHCELIMDEGGVVLRDLQSTNGTWVGPARVIDRALLTQGAEFYAGDCRLRLASIVEEDVPISTLSDFGGFLGCSRVMRELFADLARLASTRLRLLIQGETGTGKGLLARSIHDASDRASGPFVVLDCTMLTRELAEARIVGYRRGAFTGAVADQRGCFEQAHGGTLFIDEVGELPLELQPKLLRVIEEQEVCRLGDEQTRKVDVRVIAATNQDLARLIATNDFRRDLFERLAPVSVLLPPLRERPEDIGLLARTFLRAFAAESGRQMTLTDDAMAWLAQQPWPGNARELRNTMQVAAHLSPDDALTRHNLVRTRTLSGRPQPGPGVASLGVPAEVFSLPLKDGGEQVLFHYQREYCRRLLELTGGDLQQMADAAGCSVRWVRELLKRYELYAG